MKIFVILKITNFRYSGELLSETDYSITINDIRNGQMEIAKDQIAVRGIVNA